MDIAAKRDALIAAIHREESPGIIAELVAHLKRLQEQNSMGKEKNVISIDSDAFWLLIAALKRAWPGDDYAEKRAALLAYISDWADSLPQPEQAKPARIEGKLREFCGPEDFGVPTQYAKCAHNYAMWLAAQQQAKPTSIALTAADVELLAAAKAFAKEHIEGDALHEDESSDWTLVQQSDERYNATKLALCNAYRRHLTAPHGDSDKTVGSV